MERKGMDWNRMEWNVAKQQTDNHICFRTMNVKNEIGCQLPRAPLADAINPFMHDITLPVKCEMKNNVEGKKYENA